MTAERKRTLLRAALCLAAAAAALTALILFRAGQAEKEHPETRKPGTDAFLREGMVQRDGVWYRKKPGMKVLLILGIDQEDSEQPKGRANRYRNGGQADFLLITAIDHAAKQVHLLQIDRDTMADVTVLDVFGRESGSRTMQICLQHSYGANRDDRAQNTLRAVSRLLNGLELDGYLSADYSAVPALNDAIGGVTVVVPADMTSVDPDWKEGTSVTLHGMEAETFVRTRKTVGEGTNADRMTRQNEYIRKAAEQIRKFLSGNSNGGERLLAALKKYTVTSIPDQELLVEMIDASGYETLPTEYLEGSYSIGRDGFVEFHAAEGSAEEWILKCLYEPEA